MAGVLQTQIEKKLNAKLQPEHLEVVNESGRHASGPEAETHFKVVCCSQAFEGLSLVERHRLLYELLADEQKAGVHALSFQLISPRERPQHDLTHTTPDCRGGGE